MNNLFASLGMKIHGGKNASFVWEHFLVINSWYVFIEKIHIDNVYWRLQGG